MAKRFLSSLRLVNLSSDPNSSTSGEIYYNNVDNAIKYYDGTLWKEIGSGDLLVESGSSFPSASASLNGELFYNTTTKTTAIYFDSEWKQFLYSSDVQTNVIDGGFSYTSAFVSNIDGGSSSA